MDAGVQRREQNRNETYVVDNQISMFMREFMKQLFRGRLGSCTEKRSIIITSVKNS